MTTLKLGENLVDAMIAKLKAGLDARIDAINLEKADAITVEKPKKTGGASLDGSSYYTGGAGPAIPDDGIPAIIVAEGIAEYQKEGPHAFDFKPLVFLRVIDQAPEREILDKKLKRLARCVIETLWDDAPKEALVPAGSAATAIPLAYHLELYQSRPGPVSEPDIEVVHWRSHYDVIFRAVQSEGD